MKKLGLVFVIAAVACGGAENNDLFQGSSSSGDTNPTTNPPSSSGTTTSSPPGVPPPPPPDSCTKVTYYRDKDGDGVGGAETQDACTSPGKDWVLAGGDCDDGNANVHPGQTGFFPSPYSRTGGSGVSFDYDCSKVEEQQLPTRHAATTCTLTVSANACAGDGFVPVGNPRTGAGVDPLCGPVKKQTCVLKTSGGASCSAVLSDAEPTACH